MKNLITILFIAVLAITFTSCSKKETPKPEPVITWISGKWVRVEETQSAFSHYIQLNFETETAGHYVDDSNASNSFTYSLSTMIYKDGSGNEWKINKISDTKISIGTPNVTVLTYYNKQ